MTTVARAARDILLSADPMTKVKRARAARRAWRAGTLAWTFDVAMPDRPARPERPALLPPNRMPRRGRSGSVRARVAMLHALAHIEFAAIDLAFDAAGRFGAGFPRAFVDDWFAVGADEAMHFALLDRRLRALGAGYGALPAHDGLWDAAVATAHDPLARMAIVPMVLEARGLDVTPATVARVRAAGDEASARILQRIFEDEIRHVHVGTGWFEHGCATMRFDRFAHWHKMVRTHFGATLKPPFNDSARERAGLTLGYYGALAAE